MLKLKKYLYYFSIFAIIFFIVPALCTKKARSTMSEINLKGETQTFPKYDYTKYAKVRLLDKNNNQVNELEIDNYLYGVVAAEMPANFEIEALKAQAVAARTYTIYKMIHSNKHLSEDADICNDFSCCQAWISKKERLEKWKEDEREENWKKIMIAVDSTSGKIITYNHEPINAFFHSNSGGITETASNVWGEKDIPYLQSVETSGEDEYSQYSSEIELTKDELIEKLKAEYKDIKIDFKEEDCIKILEYTDSKRVKTIKFGNMEIAGTKARSLLGLKSTNFEFKIERDKIIFYVTGYGHGVGMSQTGADSMAKEGKKYEEILTHFYTGVEIENI